MDQGDDMEEMWMLPDPPRDNSFHFPAWLHNFDDSLDEAIDQYFCCQNWQKEQPVTVKLEIASEPASQPAVDSRSLRRRKPAQRNAINLFKHAEKQSRSKRKIKPSPYHNYQKHLIIAIKHILTPPEVTPASPSIIAIERMLWEAFIDNHNETKKILYFIFNEQNEYEASQDELRSFGFQQIYQSYSTEEISLAKSLMTELALEQLTHENIDHYLSTRRIKDPEKFKRYMELFVQELEEGYIKKRLSSKHRIMRRREILGREDP